MVPYNRSRSQRILFLHTSVVAKHALHLYKSPFLAPYLKYLYSPTFPYDLYIYAATGIPLVTNEVVLCNSTAVRLGLLQVH
jgi:hypothetical protein